MGFATRKRRPTNQPRKPAAHGRLQRLVALSTVLTHLSSNVGQCSAFSMVAPAIPQTQTTHSAGSVWRQTPLEYPSRSFEKERVVRDKDITKFTSRTRKPTTRPTTRILDHAAIIMPAIASPLFFHAHQRQIKLTQERISRLLTTGIVSQILQQLLAYMVKIVRQVRTQQHEVVALPGTIYQATTNAVDEISMQDSFQHVWNVAGDAMVNLGLTDMQGLHFQMVGDDIMLKENGKRIVV